MNQNEFYWTFTQAKVVIYQSIHASGLAGFLTHVQQFSRLLDKFEVWVSCGAVCDIFDQLFCLIFKMELNPLPDLLNTGFTIIEFGCVCFPAT